MADDFLKFSKKPISSDIFEFTDPKFLRKYSGLKAKLPKRGPDKVINTFKNMIIKEDNTGWNKLLMKTESVQKDEYKGVDVGLFDPISQKIIGYGIKNELGIDRPQRSYIAITFDFKKKDMMKMLHKATDGYFFKKKKAIEVLQPIGKFLKHEIRKFMYGTYWLLRKPNAALTVTKKGFDHPLIHTQKLVKSIGIRKVTGSQGKK